MARLRNKVSIKSTVYRTSRPSVFDGPWKSDLQEAFEAFLEKLRKEGLASAHSMFVAVQTEKEKGDCDVRGQWYTSDTQLQMSLIEMIKELQNTDPGLSLNPKSATRYRNIFSGGMVIGQEDLWGVEVDLRKIRLLDFQVPGVRLNTILRHVAEHEVLPAVLRFPQGEIVAHEGDMFADLARKYKNYVGGAA